ncbi:MAG: peptidase S41, partial [Elusimicrobia bacterium]|nr:peptidase S41 [Elusimicrobiota bacterium]
DALLAVDGRPAHALGLLTAAALLDGPPGTRLRLTLRRGAGAPFSVRLVRQAPEGAVPTRN